VLTITQKVTILLTHADIFCTNEEETVSKNKTQENISQTENIGAAVEDTNIPHSFSHT
jgi:hypothetical protein